MPKKLWVETYRPQSIDDFIFQDDRHKEVFQQFIDEKSFPHLLLSGHRGTGKTSLAFILINEIGVHKSDVKILNASDENSVDAIRGSVKSFALTMPIGETEFKVILLDEADYLSRSAQAALRGVMEEYSDSVRFILTCNHPHKVIPEIRDSRCTEFQFKSLDRNSMAIRAYKILKREGVKVRDADLLNAHLDECYPDMRKLLQSLQISVKDGELQDPLDVGNKGVVLVSIIEQLSEGKWLEVREHIISNIDDSEWEDIYRFLYDNLDQVEGFDNTENWMRGIVIINRHLVDHYQTAQPEPNFTSCMIKLRGVLK